MTPFGSGDCRCAAIKRGDGDIDRAIVSVGRGGSVIRQIYPVRADGPRNFGETLLRVGGDEQIGRIIE